VLNSAASKESAEAALKQIARFEATVQAITGVVKVVNSLSASYKALAAAQAAVTAGGTARSCK
jgi:hypothetical protein